MNAEQDKKLQGKILNWSCESELTITILLSSVLKHCVDKHLQQKGWCKLQSVEKGMIKSGKRKEIAEGPHTD